MRQRIVTAVVALAILLAIILGLPGIYTELAIAAVLLAAAWEWSKFLRTRNRVWRAAYVLAVAALLLVVASLAGDYREPILLIGLIWWLGAFFWTFAYPTRVPLALSITAGAMVLVPMYVALIALYQMSPWALILTLLLVWIADSAALFTGKLFGRIKLAPGISPGKTWEGVIGGLAAVALFAFVVARSLDIQALFFVPFCLAVASLSVVGDLTVSMFKRDAGIKDSGKLFPGHGGVLDRIDSISAAAPLVAIGLDWMGAR